MSMDLIIEDSAPGVRLLRLNRSASLNALSGALLSAMADELQRVEADEVVRCVVLTGDERAFSAGADLKEMPQSDLPIYAEANRLKAWKTIERFSKPLIAAVRGYALGGGCELALLCDIVIAGKGAKFGTPEIKVGMFPGDGGTQRLPRAIGKARAMLMILTGEPIDGATAASWGLAAEAVADDEVVSRAIALASSIARHSPLAARLAKEEVLMSFVKPLDESLSLERKLLLFQSADRKEGVQAFIEKREPRFTGR
ncbi:MAG: enoyl-CoA hydratase-related protein [Microvirga sp.]|jgi:enoyl-CoA hydratase